jgi:hypothetical protein
MADHILPDDASLSNGRPVDPTDTPAQPPPITKAEIERAPTPPPMPVVHFDAIPDRLKDDGSWVLWAWVRRDEHWSKMPLVERQRRTGWRLSCASSTNPNSWTTFEDVQATVAEVNEFAYRRGQPYWLSLGYVVREGGGVTVVDLDNCRVPATGEIAPWAVVIIQRLNSYTEVSPSGTGLKIFLLATKPGPRCRIATHPNIEIYDRARFVAVTGQRLDGTPEDLMPRQLELDTLYNETFPPEPAVGQRPDRGAADGVAEPVGSTEPRGPFDGSDDELLDRARSAKNGDDFARLFAGDTSAYKGDRSAADFALACRLAFWVGNDAGRIASLMWRSGLSRKKWDRRDYLDRTVARAIACTTRHFGDGHADDEFKYLDGTDITIVPPKRRDNRRPEPHPGAPVPAKGTDGARARGWIDASKPVDWEKVFPLDQLNLIAERAAAEEAKRKADAAEAKAAGFDANPCPMRPASCLWPTYMRCRDTEGPRRGLRAVVWTSCGRQTCPDCLPRLRVEHANDACKKILTEPGPLANTPLFRDNRRPRQGPVYLTVVPIVEWKAKVVALRRACRAAARSGWKKVLMDSRNYLVVATVPTAGAEAVPPKEAAARVAAAIEQAVPRIDPVTGKTLRIVSSSRGDWSLNRQKKHEWEVEFRLDRHVTVERAREVLNSFGIDGTLNFPDAGAVHARLSFHYQAHWTRAIIDDFEWRLMFGEARPEPPGRGPAEELDLAMG